MEFLYLVLGAFLAIGGGLLAQRQQQILDREEADRKLLIELRTVLAEYVATDSVLSGKVFGNVERERDLLSQQRRHIDRIERIAIELRSKKFRPLAARLVKFAFGSDSERRASGFDLTREVALLINREVIESYEADLQGRMGSGLNT